MVGKEEVCLKFSADRFMTGEFSAIVRGDRVDTCAVRFEQFGDGGAYGLRGFTLDLLDQGETSLALNQTDDGLPVAFADDGIGLPVADPATSLNDCRSQFDGLAIGDHATPVSFAVTLLALFLAAQLLPQQTACPLVGIDALIHCFMADVGMIANLLWAPLLQQALLNKLPGSIVNLPGIDHAAFVCKALRLLRAIASSALVTAQFSANSGGVALKHVGNLGWIVSSFLQGVYLVSFFSGEVCVVHLCNFDWRSKRLGCYRIPPT